MSKVEFYEDAESNWRWRVIADNGEVVADSSESYQRKADAEHGYEVAQQAPDDAE